ncbi:hypothetical protein CEXT_268511 [Caerostris extrusa]|uniref:Uncharacterized protein n=1 Tax=Caerostris extrusa TaxID=172846 RepID=A0AAV4VDE9_CAEEX|nr:hypothetical protein CEXT_268511 [Caerostris extrusa]
MDNTCTFFGIGGGEEEASFFVDVTHGVCSWNSECGLWNWWEHCRNKLNKIAKPLGNLNEGKVNHYDIRLLKVEEGVQKKEKV